MARVPSADALYAAADELVRRSLLDDRGLFADRPVWSTDVLSDLHRRFVGRYTVAGTTFAQRWSRQLAGAPDPTLQLAGELTWVHALFPADLSPATKRRLVTTTLGWARDPVVVPERLDRVLDGGLGRTGVAFKTRRQAQLRLLLEAAMDLKGRAVADRAVLLVDDPWACKRWLGGLEHDGAGTQREALLHLLHPETFEPIVSTRVKRRIAEAFGAFVPGYVQDVDEALLHVRSALEVTHGPGVRLTEPPLADRWRTRPSR